VLPWEIVNAYNNPPVSESPAIQEAPPKDLDLKDAAAKAEYDTIMNVLKDVNFNKTKAAEILKIDRKTLYNKIKIYQSL
jgi:two-component system response regulator HydG